MLVVGGGRGVLDDPFAPAVVGMLGSGRAQGADCLQTVINPILKLIIGVIHRVAVGVVLVALEVPVIRPRFKT